MRGKGDPTTIKATWTQMRFNPKTYRKLASIAAKQGLIPATVGKGQDPVKVGVMELIHKWMLEENEGE